MSMEYEHGVGALNKNGYNRKLKYHNCYPSSKTEFVVGIVEEEEICIVPRSGAILFDVVFDCSDCNPRAPNVASGNAV
jgi:hypothetical protein